MARNDDMVRILLRLPSELHARLRALADRERRSLNAQILVLLERALENEREEKAAA